MKRFITLWAALFALAGAGAQTAEVFRSEFVPFDTRDDAALLRRGNIAHYETFSPQIVVQQADTTTVGQVVEVPLLLTDRDIYLHLENVGSAYTLLVNDARVADVEDDRSPREFLISPYIRRGWPTPTATSSSSTGSTSTTIRWRSFPTRRANTAC